MKKLLKLSTVLLSVLLITACSQSNDEVEVKNDEVVNSTTSSTTEATSAEQTEGNTDAATTESSSSEEVVLDDEYKDVIEKDFSILVGTWENERRGTLIITENGEFILNDTSLTVGDVSNNKGAYYINVSVPDNPIGGALIMLFPEGVDTEELFNFNSDTSQTRIYYGNGNPTEDDAFIKVH